MQALPIEAGGFRGRTNKLVDGCYGWWCGGTWAMIGALLHGLDEEADGAVQLFDRGVFACSHLVRRSRSKRAQMPFKNISSSLPNRPRVVCSTSLRSAFAPVLACCSARLTHCTDDLTPTIPATTSPASPPLSTRCSTRLPSPKAFATTLLGPRNSSSLRAPTSRTMKRG